MINITDTVEVNKATQAIKTGVSNYLINLLMPTPHYSKTKHIALEELETKRKIAPYCAPMHEGIIDDKQGGNVKILQPGYTKDKREFSPEEALERGVGELMGGDKTPDERYDAKFKTETQSMIESAKRRMALQFAEVLRTGKIVINGKGIDHVVDFERSADLTTALSGADRWSETTADIIGDLEGMADKIFEESGSVVQTIVMSPTAWALARKNEAFMKALDNSGLNTGAMNVTGHTGGYRVGSLSGRFDIHVYQDFYQEKGSNTQQKFMGDNEVLFFGSDAEAVEAYGAIRAKGMGDQKIDYYMKGWSVEDPEVDYLMLQSAPLAILANANATACLTVA